MTPVLQMPFRDLAAVEVKPRTFRKQILKVGRIPYDGKELVFDHAYLQRAVESFKAGAFDQVPFVIADQENRHRADPEAFRGEIKALEMTGDGIDALIELTEEGAELVRKNPRLGVSARLIPDHERDGQKFPVAIEHVCATLNPRVSGLQPWQAGSIRSLSQSSNQQEVIDLSASTYTMDPLTEDQIKKLNELPEDQRKTLDTLIDGKGPEADTKDEPDEQKQRGLLKRLFGIKEDVPDDKLQGAFAKLLDDAKPEDEKTTTSPEVPETANLSKEAKDAIDLANTRAASAESSAADALKKVAEAEWNLARKAYEGEGVPPSLLDLAAPVMTSAAKTIDLSNGESVDPKDLMRKVLNEAKGTIDLSVHGSSDDTEKKFSDKDWEASV